MLNAYVTDGMLVIDDNVTERVLKPFSIGCKSRLFFGSDDGGRRGIY